MNTKLTLVLDKEIIDKAKIYAKSNKRSLSALVENYLKALTTDKEYSEFELSETVQNLRGSLKTLYNQ